MTRVRSLLAVSLSAFFLSLPVLTLSAQAAEFVAYAVTPQGEIPLPENLQPVHTEHLVNLKWSDFSGSRARVAVSKVDNTSTMASYSSSNNQGYSGDISFAFQTVPVNGIEAMVTDVMNRTGRFRLVERQAIGNVLQEQDFGASGRVAQPSAARTGQVLGAEYLVEVVITSYEPGISGQNVNVGALARNSKFGGLLGGVSVGSRKSLIGLNFRLIDATTSEVMFTRQIDRQLTESGLSFGGGGFGSSGALGGFVGQYAQTPIGQAVIAAINEGVYELVQQIGSRPVTGSVVKAEGSNVILNLGAGQVAVGDRLTLLRRGEALIDPDTGISLGTMDTEIGAVEVTSVQDRFSVSRMVGGGGARANDVVKSQRPPPSLHFASSTDPILTKKPNSRKARR
ncbi:MAG: CsgG/HfaB family protein [Lysobacteraceae bacterium]